MINRYSRPEMTSVWTEERKFNAYLKVEIEAAAAWNELGVIPTEELELLTSTPFQVVFSNSFIVSCLQFLRHLFWVSQAKRN